MDLETKNDHGVSYRVSDERLGALACRCARNRYAAATGLKRRAIARAVWATSRQPELFNTRDVILVIDLDGRGVFLADLDDTHGATLLPGLGQRNCRQQRRDHSGCGEDRKSTRL